LALKQAIDFTLPDANGRLFNLFNILKEKNVVLYFYPKDMTPGCTLEACDFRDLNLEFQNLNTLVVGISKDTVAKHQKFAQKYNLPFVLLSDVKLDVCKKYQVIRQKSMFGKSYLGIERSTFVLEKGGKVLKEYRNVKAKNHAKEVLEFVLSVFK